MHCICSSSSDSLSVWAIDIEVSRLAIVCPCLFRIGTVPVIGLYEVKVGKLSEALINKNF